MLVFVCQDFAHVSASSPIENRYEIARESDAKEHVVLNQKKSSVSSRSRKSGLDGRADVGGRDDEDDDDDDVRHVVQLSSSATAKDSPLYTYLRTHTQFFVPNGGNNGW